MLTIAFRSRPGNTEWQYKTILTKKTPEAWLIDRLDPLDIGELRRVEINILYAREIGEDVASRLAERLIDRPDNT